MERKTNKPDFVTWDMICYECGCKFTAYSWNYNDPPTDYCCSDECYHEYETIHNKRDRRIDYLLDPGIMMKESFKIVCVNNKPMKGVNEKTQNLTIGKVYETYDRPDYSSVVVINDIGNEVNYSSHRFITIEEWRERKLNEILNEV